MGWQRAGVENFYDIMERVIKLLHEASFLHDRSQCPGFRFWMYIVFPMRYLWQDAGSWKQLYIAVPSYELFLVYFHKQLWEGDNIGLSVWAETKDSPTWTQWPNKASLGSLPVNPPTMYHISHVLYHTIIWLQILALLGRRQYLCFWRGFF